MYTNIDGRSRATAEALLAAAERVGVDPHEVRTRIGGYIVPDAVAVEYQRMLDGETEPVVTENAPEIPDGSWKNPDIKAWAEAHEVDLGGATKKADMLAAIQAAGTEEG